jgi:hypothetical protein
VPVIYFLDTEDRFKVTDSELDRLTRLDHEAAIISFVVLSIERLEDLEPLVPLEASVATLKPATWEYSSVNWDDDHMSLNDLNRLGGDGWELCYRAHKSWVFKRRKFEEAEPNESCFEPGKDVVESIADCYTIKSNPFAIDIVVDEVKVCTSEGGGTIFVTAQQGEDFKGFDFSTGRREYNDKKYRLILQETYER